MRQRQRPARGHRALLQSRGAGQRRGIAPRSPPRDRAEIAPPSPPSPTPRRVLYTWQILADFHCVPDICLPMVAPGKGLDEMFLPGTLSLEKEGQPKMEGMAPS